MLEFKPCRYRHQKLIRSKSCRCRKSVSWCKFFDRRVIPPECHVCSKRDDGSIPVEDQPSPVDEHPNYKLPELFGREDVAPTKIRFPAGMMGLSQISNAVEVTAELGPEIFLDADHRAAMVLTNTDIVIPLEDGSEKKLKASPKDWFVFTSRGDTYVIPKEKFERRFPDIVNAYMAHYTNTSIPTKD